MRIRKNAKISTLFSTNTNLSNNGDESLLHKNLCQLNQSPWDIITFPSADSSSSSHQFDDYEVYYDVNHAGNGRWVDSVRDFERFDLVDDVGRSISFNAGIMLTITSKFNSIFVYSICRKITLGENVASVKTFEDENDDLVDLEDDHKEVLGFEEGEMKEIREEMLLCDVEDKKGWQCGRVVTNGVTVCDRHIKKMQNDHAVWSTKKKSQPVREPVAETRARRTKKRASTSPYEFYYYSGFGPSWGKKRGAAGSSFSSAYNEPAEVAFDDDEIKKTGSTNGYTAVRKEEGTRFEPETSEVGPAHEDDDDNKKVKTGKKRGRKPMKARSLKSLM
ncbi:hypothetical protein SSX86_004732 [Deinandra increscens subsp. villosa]|uniref:WRC domain-containing protein n=1 Tax=Deinandra increscens subsp. villosa TaxID=3103831 RepID=A0AAP0DNP6_9ASTR